MTAPELTLDKVRQSPKLQEAQQTFRVSDFLTNEEREARVKRRAKPAPKKKFNRVDAFVAEMIGRFGYDFYKEWNAGLIDHDKVKRLLAAERAREKQLLIPLESIIAHLTKDCIRRSKKEKKPTGPKEAAKILKAEIKVAMGE